MRDSVLLPLISYPLQGVKLTFFSDSHPAPKLLKVAANSKKKLIATLKDKQNPSPRCQRSRQTLQSSQGKDP